MESLVVSMRKVRIARRRGKAAKNRTNWGNLSDDLKLKCIDEMDFKTRTGLRAASKSSRHLVDLQRYPVARLHIQLLREPTAFGIHVASAKFGDELHVLHRTSPWWKFWSSDAREFARLVECLKQVLARCQIEQCHVETRGIPHADRDVERIHVAIVAGPKLRIRTLKFAFDTSAAIKFAILNQCDVDFLRIDLEEEADRQKIPNVTDFARFSQVRIFERIDQQWKNGTCQLKAGYLRLAVAVRWVKLDNQLRISIDYGRTQFGVAKQFVGIQDLSHYEDEKALRIVTRRQKNRHIWIWISPETNRLYCFLMPDTSSFSNFQRLLNDEPDDDVTKGHFDWVWMAGHNYCRLSC